MVMSSLVTVVGGAPGGHHQARIAPAPTTGFAPCGGSSTASPVSVDITPSASPASQAVRYFWMVASIAARSLGLNEAAQAPGPEVCPAESRAAIAAAGRRAIATGAELIGDSFGRKLPA